MIIISNATTSGINPFYPLLFKKTSLTARVVSVRFYKDWIFTYLIWGFANLVSTIAILLFFERSMACTDLLSFSILLMTTVKTIQMRPYSIELQGSVILPASPMIVLEFAIYFWMLAAGAILASYQFIGTISGISIALAFLSMAIGVIPTLNFFYMKLFWKEAGYRKQ